MLPPKRYFVRLGSIEAIHLFIVAVQRENSFNQESKEARKIANQFADPTTDKTPRPRARPNQAVQAASDKEADSQTEEVLTSIAKVQHQEQPQAGGLAQEAAAEPVETEAKLGRANQGTQTMEQQPVIHSVNHMFFLLAKMVHL
ncbi:hypothetical protein H5410_044979 [Solanum commersonii]|uniref:Uncharacterized protein n=1 Tax=Solanum commersonii TaxID=4109 RepID=A0A9J5X8B4_SOLCO|nr:hypothetical protein H5410_044979 [Solanum commersonii]